MKKGFPIGKPFLFIWVDFSVLQRLMSEDGRKGWGLMVVAVVAR